MQTFFWAPFLLVLAWRLVIGQNLIPNPSFEESLNGNWQSTSSDLQRVHDEHGSHLGHYYAKSFNRRSANAGLRLDSLPMVSGGRYAFNAYVKLLDASQTTSIWELFKVAITFTYTDQTSQSLIVAERGFVKASSGWIALKGDIKAPEIPFHSVSLVIRGPNTGVDFAIDDVQLYALAEISTWREDSFASIETFRKSDATFSVTLPHGVSPSDVDLQIKLKKHHFAFGSLVKHARLLASSTSDYSKLFFYLFNWAVVQTYKWKLQKGNETHPDFSHALDTTDVLNQHGVSVRGHSIFWNVEKNVPDWVKVKPNAELPAILFNHLDYIVNISRGKLAHWDVQNEHISNHYYENRLGPAYANLTKEFFRLAKRLDPDTTLYFNDFTGVTSGAHTQEMHDLMLEYLAEGVPVDGLGIQGHTKANTKPDPTMIWRRLDVLAETGLELFMTEFDVGWPDVVERADWFEDALRAFFAHPKLSGVILWGFLDIDMPEQVDHELVSGEQLTILEPGQRWVCLVKKEWTTDVTKNLGVSGLTFTVRGFQGDYEVIVRKSGVPVQKETFSLGKTDKTVNIHVNTATHPLTLTKEHDYVPQCVSHRGRRSLGNVTSNTSENQLSCRNKLSAETGLAENDEVTVECHDDEILTSCSAFHMGKVWMRNGDKIVVENGVAKCKVYNGRNSNDGVKAFARCCKLSGLTCDYRTAGPSSPMDGAQAEAICPSGYTPLGCSSYSRYPDFDGGYPDLNRRSCLAQSGAPILANSRERSGAIAYASCCKASGLSCQVVASEETLLTAGSRTHATCPSGSVMTGCTAFSENGKSSGAKLFDDHGILKCRVFLGADLPAGSVGAKALATCCTLT